MNKKEAENRIKKLRLEIDRLRFLYHVEDDAHVTDDIYDSLNKELKSLLIKYPEFIDPNYLYITLDTKVKFDPKNSRYTDAQIQTLVTAKIQEYFSTELQKFDKDFIYSKLSKTIDSIDTSIIGNVSNFKLQKRISPTINIRNNYTGTNIIKFANKLISGSIQSTGFYYKINYCCTYT